MKALAVLLFSIIFVSACIEQPREIKEITIPGHGSQVYTFSNDIKTASKVFANDEQSIRNIFLQNERIMLIFDGSSQQDNAYFTVVATNLGKIQTYLAYEGRIFSFEPIYFIDEKWYDRTGTEILKPELNNSLWLKGPSTGANGTSVTVEGNTIYLQGTDYKNLTLAADKLVLVVFNYEPSS